MSDPEFKEEKSEIYSNNMTEAMGAGKLIMLSLSLSKIRRNWGRRNVSFIFWSMFLSGFL